MGCERRPHFAQGVKFDDQMSVPPPQLETASNKLSVKEAALS
ncbi:hypothetical protein [Rhizobium sp. FKY42]|nr:hypothetical protein [Rhizobium sp. FKY42]